MVDHEGNRPDFRALIACAGPQSKWKNYLNVPSPLAPLLDGTPMLRRTVNQLVTRTRDVHVVGPDERYALAEFHQILERPSEFASTRPWWNPLRRTILLLGDVYFTDEALGKISTSQKRDSRFSAAMARAH